MAVLLDSYSESNQDENDRLGAENVGEARYERYAQSFDPGAGTLDSAKFYLLKIGSPTGNAVAKLYAHSGTYGTDSVPTGAALATSGTFDVSTLTGSYVLYTFNFTGGDRYALQAATKYCIAIEYNGGDASNHTSVGGDHSSPTHGGNASRWQAGAWSVGIDGGVEADLPFYVYGADVQPISAWLTA